MKSNKLQLLNTPYHINFIETDDINYLMEKIFTSKVNFVNFMYFANFSLLDSDEEYLQAMQNSDYVLVDGIGMQIYFKVLLQQNVHNNNGTVLMPIIIKYCKDKSLPIAFYGAKEVSVFACMNKHKESSVYYAQDGYRELDWSGIKNNSVLFIGLGSPYQEKWQLLNKDIIIKKNIVVFGVGGFFDFCSSNSKRAPDIIIKMKLEWLYRFCLNPKQHSQKNLRNLKIFKYIFRAWRYKNKEGV